MFKKISLLLLTSFLFASCTIPTHSIFKSKSDNTSNLETVIKDEIVALGQAVSSDNELSSKLLLSGKNYSYLITFDDGGLQNILKSLDSNYLTVAEVKSFVLDSKPIQLSVNQVGEFSGEIAIYYNKNSKQISNIDSQNLNRLGFAPDILYGVGSTKEKVLGYVKQFAIKGKIYPVVGNIAEVKPQNSKKMPRVILQATNTKTSSNGHLVLDLPDNETTIAFTALDNK